jgi:hypothetical protein
MTTTLGFCAACCALAGATTEEIAAIVGSPNATARRLTPDDFSSDFILQLPQELLEHVHRVQGDECRVHGGFDLDQGSSAWLDFVEMSAGATTKNR